MREPGFRYANAPIAEAVFDIVVTPAMDALARLRNLELGEDYPVRKEAVLLEGQIQATDEGVSTNTRRNLVGFRFLSPDEKQILLTGQNRFTFSRLHPYESWREFSREALRLWDLYSRATAPTEVVRLGLRYINQIELPQGPVDIAQYLRTRPEISEDMPTQTTGYFLNLEIPMPDHAATLHLVETILAEDNRSSLVLDIDVFRSVELDRGADLTKQFDSLRAAKNLVFEASITEDARRLFN